MVLPNLITSTVNSNFHSLHHLQQVDKTQTRSILSSHIIQYTTTLFSSIKPRWYLLTSLSPMIIINTVTNNCILTTNISSFQLLTLSILSLIRSGVSLCQTRPETPPLSWLKRLFTTLDTEEGIIYRWRWTVSKTRFCRIINSLGVLSMLSNQKAKFLSVNCQLLC